MCATSASADNLLANVSRLRIDPQEFVLSGDRERLQILVTGQTDTENVVDLSSKVVFQTETKGIIRVSQSGRIEPIADGTTRVTAAFENLQVTANVTVKGMGEQQPVSFDFHTLPILAQTGCSGGSCHGSPHGKAGFRLSLFASDRELDRIAITRELFGRRVNPIEP